MSIIPALGTLASQNAVLAYFIIYLCTIFLGNVSAFVGFWIVLRGYLGLWGAPLLIVTVFLADVSGDLLWYSLGRATRATPLGKWIWSHIPRHDHIEEKLQRNGKGWLFASKFLYASTFPLVFSIGWSGVNFRRFFRNSLFSVLLWLPILIGLAYGLASGLSPLSAMATFRNFEFLFFAGLLLFMILHYVLAKTIAKIMSRRTQERTNLN